MDFLQGLLNLRPLFLVKLFILLFEVLYIIFAFVLLRQERLMSQTVEISTSSFFKLLVNVNFIVSIGVFILSLLLLHIL